MKKIIRAISTVLFVALLASTGTLAARAQENPEEELIQPLAMVKVFADKGELDALAEKFANEIVGRVDFDAPDKLFFLPIAIPIVFEVYAVDDSGGEVKTRERLERYEIEDGQAFVYCGTQEKLDEETQDMALQYVISVSLKDNPEMCDFMWRLTSSESENTTPLILPWSFD